jgi:hypothetical protein
MSNALAQILAQQIPVGIYRWSCRRSAAAIAREAAAAGWRCFTLDGSAINNKASFLATCAVAFGWPAYVGHNWDSFEEAINDLSWAPAQGYLVVYDDPDPFAEGDPENWQIAQSILRDASGNWSYEQIPFISLIRAASQRHDHIPRLEHALAETAEDDEEAA